MFSSAEAVRGIYCRTSRQWYAASKKAAQRVEFAEVDGENEHYFLRGR